MKLKDCVIAWMPGVRESCLVLSIQQTPPAGFNTTGGACHPVPDMTKDEAKTFLLAEALLMVERDGQNPKTVHAALLQVDEYQEIVRDGPDFKAVRQALSQMDGRMKACSDE